MADITPSTSFDGLVESRHVTTPAATTPIQFAGIRQRLTTAMQEGAMQGHWSAVRANVDSDMIRSGK